jgi:hypothetical protein
MADVTLKRLEEFPAYGKGVFVAIRDELGISSFGINIERWPPNAIDHPEHDELDSGQEEVYIVLEGAGLLVVDGEEHQLVENLFVRVGPSERRKLLAGPNGLTVLCLGAVPGSEYRPSGPTA